MAGARGNGRSLTVSVPHFTQGLLNLRVTSLGAGASLECRVQGYPRPEVKWEKGGKTVGKSRNIQMTRSGDRCLLQIRAVQDTDVGKYDCVAVNMLGTAKSRGGIFLTDTTEPMQEKKNNHNLSVPSRVRAIWSSVRAKPSECSKSSNKDDRKLIARDIPISQSPSATRRAEPNREVSTTNSGMQKKESIFTSRASRRSTTTTSRNNVVKTAEIKSVIENTKLEPLKNGQALSNQVKIPAVFQADGSCNRSSVRSKSPFKVRNIDKVDPSKNKQSVPDSENYLNSQPVLNGLRRFLKIGKVRQEKVNGVSKKGSVDTFPHDKTINKDSCNFKIRETVPCTKERKSEFFVQGLLTTANGLPDTVESDTPHENDMNTCSLRTCKSSGIEHFDHYAVPEPLFEPVNHEADSIHHRDQIKDTNSNADIQCIPTQNIMTDTSHGSDSCDEIITSVLEKELTSSAFLNSEREFDNDVSCNSSNTSVPAIQKAATDIKKIALESSAIFLKDERVVDSMENTMQQSGDPHWNTLAETPEYEVPNAKSNNFCDEPNPVVSKFNETTEDEVVVQECSTLQEDSEHVIEIVETSPEEEKDPERVLKRSNLSIPTIRIQKSLKTSEPKEEIADEKGDASSELQTATEQYNSSEQDVRGFERNINNLYVKIPCTGKIRYSTPVIEECQEFVLDTSGFVDEEEEIEDQSKSGEDEVDLQRAVSPCESPAVIVRGPQSVTVLRGESVTLAIYFTGTPQPLVTWIKGGRVLRDCGRHTILAGRDMSALTVSDVTADDSGKYVVCVENEGGGDSRFASVAVVGFPEPPGGEPTASDFTDHSLVLSWYGSMYDGGSVVTGYVVEMCILPDKKWHRVSGCVNTSFVVQGLSCGQRYIFRVRAENRYGVSHPSRVSQMICLDDYLCDVLYQEEKVEIPDEPVKVEVGTQFSEQFDLKEEVGKGRFGTVYRCVQNSTGRPRAAKVIRCLKIKDKEKVRLEIDIMNRLHHNKLMQILAAFESGRNMIMVMEYISGGELFERVIADDFVLTERDCALFMQQICDAVAYMHRCSVLHLDLKPENILCKTRTSHQIKIIDFGLARVYSPEENLRILFGTPEFVAPEVISYEPVGPASDMWSVGVICYVLLSGLSPFMGDSDPETFANITRGEMDFDDEAFDSISEEAKDFISSLLVKRPKLRMSAEECLKHRWLKSVSIVQSRDLPLSTEKLKKFIIRRKWQKTGTAIRALGRMVSLSRSSMGSSCESSSPLGSPTSLRSRPWVSRSETTESGDSEVFQDTDSNDLSR